MTFSGTKPGSAANGTSPGNGYVDLAIPVNTQTSNWGVEGGYQSGKATFALRWDYSKFDNGAGALQWTNPFFGSNQLDTTYLAPDNTFNKFTVSGNYRDLPWRSVISARYTWAKTTSDTSTRTVRAQRPAAPSYNPTLPDTGTFNGENVNQSFALAWTATPVANVDIARLLLLDEAAEQLRPRSSTATRRRSHSRAGSAAAICVVAGVPTQIVGNCEQRALRLHQEQRRLRRVVALRARQPDRGFGYDYNNLDQTRVDYDKAHWNKVWVEYKNTMLDTLSGRFKYEYLKRDATLNYSNNPLPNGGANNPNYLLPYTSAFDMQSNTTNQVEALPRLDPGDELLALSFEGNWSRINFDDVTYGRTNNDHQGYYLSGNWSASEQAEAQRIRRLGGEQVSVEPPLHRHRRRADRIRHRDIARPRNPNCYDPFAAGRTRTDGSYNWNSETKDTTWMIGVGADWPVDAKRWMLKASYLYVSNERQRDVLGTQAQRPPFRRTRSTSATSTTRSSSTST